MKILFYNSDLCEASIFKSLFCTNKNALVFKIDAVAVKMVLVIIINYYSLNSLLHYIKASFKTNRHTLSERDHLMLEYFFSFVVSQNKFVFT